MPKGALDHCPEHGAYPAWHQYCPECGAPDDWDIDDNEKAADKPVEEKAP